MTANENAAFAGYDSKIVIDVIPNFVDSIVQCAQQELTKLGINIVRVLLHECHYQYSRCISGSLNSAWNVLGGKIDHRTVEILSDLHYFIKGISYSPEREARLLLICDKEPPTKFTIQLLRSTTILQLTKLSSVAAMRNLELQ